MRPTKVKPIPALSKNKNTPLPQGPLGTDPSSPRGSPFPDPSSRRQSVLQDTPRGSPFPDPSSRRRSLLQDTSSPRGSPFPDPSSRRQSLLQDTPSPRGSPFPGPSSRRQSLLPDTSSPRGSPFPGPSSRRQSLLPDTSSPRGSPFPGPSSPRQFILQDTSSPRDSVLPGPSSAKGLSKGPDPTSSSGSPFPDPSTPKSSLLLNPSSSKDRALSESSSSTLGFDSASFKSVLSPESSSPGQSTLLNLQRSSELMSQDLLFLGGAFQPLRGRSSVLKIREPIGSAKKLEDDGLTWLCATIALLMLCSLLLALVSLMSMKVRDLEKKSTEQIDAMSLKVLLLTELLRELQIGKAWTCAMCRIYWVQRGNLCFLFSDLGMSWHSSKNFCEDEFSTLAIMETKEELDFLRQESSRQFIMSQGEKAYRSFWIGLKYHNSTSLALGDGTRLHINLTVKAGPNPCICLQNGKLYAEPCFIRHSFICQTQVEFGWN